MNARDSVGKAVLHWCANSENGSAELCKYFLSKGIGVNVKTSRSETTLDGAAPDEVRKYLIRQEAKKALNFRSCAAGYRKITPLQITYHHFEKSQI